MTVTTRHGYGGPLFPDPHADEPDPDEYDPAADGYPIETWVDIDGILAPCTPDTLRVGQPTILDGLSFSWGRDTSVDQPEPNTCSFTIREQLHVRDEGINQVTDPTFSDEELNATRFPDSFEVEGGQVTIAPGAGIANLAYDPSFADRTDISAGGSANIQLASGVNNAPVLYGDTVLSVAQNASGTDTTLQYPTAYVQNNGAYPGPYKRVCPLEPGKTYNASVYVAAETGGTLSNANALKLNLIHVASDGTQNTNFAMSEAGTPDGQWHRLSVAFTVPDDTSKISFRLIANYIGTDSITGSKLRTFWDGLQVTEGTELLPYRDEENIPTDSADSYRVWLIGDKTATKATAGPPNYAPANGAMPVSPGQAITMSVTVSASLPDREVRWQLQTYDETGAGFGGARYVGANTKVPGPPGTPMRFESTWTVPDDGTAYLAVAFVVEGTFGGSVTISGPDIFFGGGASILDTIHVGSQIEIWSRADVPVSDAEVMDPLMFGSAGAIPDDTYTVISGDQPDQPYYYPGIVPQPTTIVLRRAGDWDWSTTVAFPPRPFNTDDNDSLIAWDLVPRLGQGSTWYASINAYLPPGVTGTLRAWAYSGPEKADLAGECTVTGAQITGTGSVDQMTAGTWNGSTFLTQIPLSGEVTLPASLDDPAGYWIAVGIEITPMPSPLTWADTPGTWADQVLRWIDLQQAWVEPPSLLQEESSLRSALIWSGEVTGLVAQAAGDEAYTVSVTASDLSSILSNVKVGDEPWPVETLEARAAKIMALIPQSPPLRIDDSLKATIVSYRDVDAQPPLGLLQDLAQTAGGVLWIAAHATEGAYLWMEDPRNREAVRRFVVDPDTGAVSIQHEGDAEQATVTTISAMDILRDPVNWTQDVSQVITQASVSWLEQIPPDGEGQQASTEEHTVVVQDTPDVIKKYHVRDISLGTELTTEADAMELAGRILALSRGVSWRASGLEYDTLLLVRDIDTVDYPTRLSTVMDLLDATMRIGYPFTLVDMPEWTPAGAVRSMYVEGGTWTWENRRWHLSMTATPSAGQGQSARWMDFDGTGVRWQDFRPHKIRWIDAYGTAGPVVTAPRELEHADA